MSKFIFVIALAILALVGDLMLNGSTSQAQATELQSGVYGSLKGNVRYCELSRGRHSTANIRAAKNMGAKLYSARQLNLTLVHMNPMGSRNYHATAVFGGQRVPVCIPHPDESVYAIRQSGKLTPVVMYSCGNKVIAYAIENKRRTRKSVYAMVDTPGGEGSSSTGRPEGHGETPGNPGVNPGRGEGHGGTPANPDAVADGSGGGHADGNGGNDGNGGGRGGEGHGGTSG